MDATVRISGGRTVSTVSTARSGGSEETADIHRSPGRSTMTGDAWPGVTALSSSAAIIG